MPEDSGTGADGAASRRPGAPGIFVGVWRKGMSGEKGNAQYFSDAQRWFEQISPTIARMRLLFHEDPPRRGGEPCQEVSLMLEHFTVDEPEFELYFEVASSLRLTELRVELLDQEEKVVQNLCGFITPRGVYSETTLIPGEPLGPRTWGIRILAQKESGWLLLANGRPVLDAPAPASTPLAVVCHGEWIMARAFFCRLPWLSPTGSGTEPCPTPQAGENPQTGPFSCHGHDRREGILVFHSCAGAGGGEWRGFSRKVVST